jgi:uncharacterized protein YgiM (DUF1202 family)
MNCPECGLKNEDSALFCWSCGSGLNPAEPLKPTIKPIILADAEPPTAAQPTTGAEKAKEAPIHCAVCGQPNPPDQLSCQSCGKRLSHPVEGRGCPYCSALNVYGARFCWRCGMPLTTRGALWWALTAALLGLAVIAAGLAFACQAGLLGNAELQLGLFFTLSDLALAATAILLATSIFNAVIWRRTGSGLWTLGSIALASATFLVSISAILLKISLFPGLEVQTTVNFTPASAARLLAGLFLLGLALRVLSAWRPALAWGCLLTLGLGGLCYGGVLLAGGFGPQPRLALKTATLQATPTTTATPVPTPTLAPTGAPSPASTATRRPPTRTPTPLPEAIVAAGQANLRSGPGANYDLIGQLPGGEPLDVLGRNRGNDWLEVATTRRLRGWVSAELVKLNIAAGIIPVSSRIPPTPTPPATPTATRPPAAQACPLNPALVEVNNQLSTPLTLVLTGPEQATLEVPPAAAGRYCLLAGVYLFTARAPGYTDHSGTRTFEPGKCQCWNFSPDAPAPSADCSCNASAALYTRP